MLHFAQSSKTTKRQKDLVKEICFKIEAIWRSPVRELATIALTTPFARSLTFSVEYLFLYLFAQLSLSLSLSFSFFISRSLSPSHFNVRLRLFETLKIKLIQNVFCIFECGIISGRASSKFEYRIYPPKMVNIFVSDRRRNEARIDRVACFAIHSFQRRFDEQIAVEKSKAQFRETNEGVHAAIA